MFILSQYSLLFIFIIYLLYMIKLKYRVKFMYFEMRDIFHGILQENYSRLVALWRYQDLYSNRVSPNTQTFTIIFSLLEKTAKI